MSLTYLFSFFFKKNPEVYGPLPLFLVPVQQVVVLLVDLQLLVLLRDCVRVFGGQDVHCSTQRHGWQTNTHSYYSIRFLILGHESIQNQLKQFSIHKFNTENTEYSYLKVMSTDSNGVNAALNLRQRPTLGHKLYF